MRTRREFSKELAKEWHPTKNGDLLPSDFSGGSGVKVWWLGKCGHEWNSHILGRHGGTGCPVCAGKVILQGFNDLATTHAGIAEEWDYEKNKITPTEIGRGSKKKVWWIGKDCGHSWVAPINNRTTKTLATGCPYCANKAVLVGFNDLATTHPELASEWHPDLNEIRPTEITAGISKKIWWICEAGHEYDMTPANRKYGGNCPFCSNHKAYKGFNDLTTTHPELLQYWSKNNTLAPYDVLAGSKKKHLWVCNKEHEWSATVKMAQEYPCPHCFGRKLTIGRNDLETMHPEIFTEFHPDKKR